MDPQELEQLTGTRSTYQALPNSQPQLEALFVPLVLHLTPRKPIEHIYTSFEPPTKCACGAHLNPYCTIHHKTNSWFCPFCTKHNKFSQTELARLGGPQTPPPEVLLENLAIEYKLPEDKTKASTGLSYFWFVVDTCMGEENMQGLKKSLASAVEQLDFERTRVAVLSYSRGLFLHRRTASSGLGHSILMPCYFSLEQLHTLLNVKPDPKNKALVGHTISELFFHASKEAAIGAVEEIECDYWSTADSERAHRATGKALEVALDLLSMANLTSARLVLFTAGPCTIGPGAVAELKLSSFIRHHNDLEENKEVKSKSDLARTFYTGLSTKAVANSITVDIFAFSLTEFGLYEMRDLAGRTGGIVVVNEEFKSEHFANSIRKFFASDERGEPLLSTNGLLEVLVSKELQIAGCIGNCSSLNNKAPNLSSAQIGESNTNAWHLGGLDPQSTILLFFDITEKNKGKGYQRGHNAFWQFVITYLHATHGLIRRVVTLQKPFVSYTNPSEMVEYLDQFSIISAYAKIAAYKTLESDNAIVIRYLDKTLINILRTFRLNGAVPDALSLIPQYFYYLRKSNFIKKLASSLDEMTHFKHVVLRETMENTLIIVQPQVVEYSLESAEPVPVLPDIDCLKKEVVLLVDTFFNVIIWRGSTIKSWVDAGYHLNPEYEHVARLLQMPEDDSGFIIEDRVLVPCKVYSHFDAPTERLLKSRLNPENKNIGKHNEAVESGVFVSDDASLSTFMTRLLQVVNNPS